MGVQFSWDSGISRRLKSLAMRSDSRWWCRKVWQLLSCSTSWNNFLPEAVCDLSHQTILFDLQSSHGELSFLRSLGWSPQLTRSVWAKVSTCFYVKEMQTTDRTFMGRQNLLYEGRRGSQISCSLKTVMFQKAFMQNDSKRFPLNAWLLDMDGSFMDKRTRMDNWQATENWLGGHKTSNEI